MMQNLGMRPIKERYIDGVLLVDNLYQDPKKRQGFFRYKRPDGTFKTFQASTAEEANVIAEEANALRDSSVSSSYIPERSRLEFHVPRYIAYREKIDPILTTKISWTNRKYTLYLFAKEFPKISLLEIETIRAWWDELTNSQQKMRMAEFRRFFNWLMSEGLISKISFNPFTTSDDLPRLLLKQREKKHRRPLTQDNYHRIIKKADEVGYEALVIAMEISRYTTLRESDICNLKWDENIINRSLRVVVSKSEAQKGTARATRLSWDLDEHPVLKKSIDRAREINLQHKRCPFILSHKPKRRIWNEEKDHLYQVTSDRLSRMFREVRDLCGIENTSFHEVRGLSSTLYKSAGYTNEQIKTLMAHESISTTIGYQNPNELPYMPVQIKLEK